MATASITVGANTGGGAREYVAAALDVLDELGVHYELTAMATNVEGSVETICGALAAIHKRCHELGAPRGGELAEDRRSHRRRANARIEGESCDRSSKDNLSRFR